MLAAYAGIASVFVQMASRMGTQALAGWAAVPGTSGGIGRLPPRHPQTNGMAERFNGRISEIVNQTRFESAAELESTLRNYVKIYNHSIPQRALMHQTPIQALKKSLICS